VKPPLAAKGSQLSEIEKSYEVARTLSARCSYLYNKFPVFGSDLGLVELLSVKWACYHEDEDSPLFGFRGAGSGRSAEHPSKTNPT
jgi:hypothetical protein